MNDLTSKLMSGRMPLAVGAAAAALAAAGCGASSSGGQAAKPVSPNGPEVSPAGDIPDNQAYVPYAPAGGGFSVKVPEGWSRSTAGGAVTFTDKLNAIRVESKPAQVALTARDARQTELPKLAASVKDFRPGRVTTVGRKAGTAVRITYLAKSAGDPVTGKAAVNAVERYVFFHKAKELVLTLTGPKGADNVDPWKIVTDSVTWSR